MKYTKAQYLRSTNTAFVLAALFVGFLFQNCGDRSGGKVKDVELTSDVDSFSYAYGMMISRFLKDVKHWDGINHEVFEQAVREYLENDSSSVMNEESAESLVNVYDKKMAVRYVANAMEENKAKEGVNTMESGLQYKVISEGEGVQPQLGDSVEIHYDISLYGGEILFSSRQMGQPQKMLYTNEIMFPGMVEALAGMKSGSEWELTVPPKLAFGDQGAQSIPPYSILQVNLTLIEVYKNN